MPLQIFEGAGGAAPSPLDTLTKMMMMKKQYEEEEKQRQAEFKRYQEKEKLRIEGETSLAKIKSQIETESRQNQFNEELKRAMSASEGLRQGFTDPNAVGPFQPGITPMTPLGQQMAPLSDYFAKFGQSIPPSALAGVIGGQSREKVAGINTEGRETVEGIKAANKLDIEDKETERALKLEKLQAASKMAALKLSMSFRQDMNEANNTVRIAIAKMKAGETPTDRQKSDLAAAKMIEYVAKNIAGGGEITEKERAQAIKELAAMFPDTFGDYVQAVGEEEEDWLYKMTLGIFGNKKPKIKPFNNQRPPIDDVLGIE